MSAFTYLAAACQARLATLVCVHPADATTHRGCVPFRLPRAPMTPELRTALERATQAALDAAERLIAMLDRLDAGPDLEPEDPDACAREWCGSGAHRFDVGLPA